MKYSLYILGDIARLNPVANPVLVTEQAFSSASAKCWDHYTKRPFWLTRLADVREGIHSIGGWQFAIQAGSAVWAKESKNGSNAD